MTNRRRAFLITVSVSAGTLISAFLWYNRKGDLQPNDYLWLVTNLFMSLILIVGIGWIVSWRKKD